MKLSNEQVYIIYQNLIKLSSFELPIKISFAIAKNIQILQGTYQIIEEMRQQIFLSAPHDDLGNGQIKIKEEAITEVNEKIKELSFQEAEYDLMTLNIEDIPPEVKLTAAEVEGLFPIFGQ